MGWVVRIRYRVTGDNALDSIRHSYSSCQPIFRSSETPLSSVSNFIHRGLLHFGSNMEFLSLSFVSYYYYEYPFSYVYWPCNRSDESGNLHLILNSLNIRFIRTIKSWYPVKSWYPRPFSRILSQRPSRPSCGFLKTLLWICLITGSKGFKDRFVF